MTLDLTEFDALTFDCYGTLIDWSAGILAALRSILGGRARGVGDERLLSLYGVLEAEARGRRRDRAYCVRISAWWWTVQRESGSPIAAWRDAPGVDQRPAGVPDTPLGSLKTVLARGAVEHDRIAVLTAETGVELDAAETGSVI